MVKPKINLNLNVESRIGKGLDSIFDSDNSLVALQDDHDSLILTNTNTSTQTKFNTNTKTNFSTDTDTNVSTNTETIFSTNISTKSITIEKRLKYTEERLHRAYYIKKDLVKKIDKLSKKTNMDKSDIVCVALNLLFESLDDKI